MNYNIIQLNVKSSEFEGIYEGEYLKCQVQCKVHIDALIVH